MTVLERAIQIALHAHAGQKDKAGSDYILHPLRVMLRGVSPEEKIVGVLHDVIEDSDITALDLLNEGFSSEIVDAILALSHRPDEDYISFIYRVLENSLAKRVKLYDLLDNTDILRLNKLDDKDLVRLNKYIEAIKIIESAH